MSYKLINDLLTGEPIDYVLRKKDNAQIPFDLENMDYVEYIEWVKAGNTAEAAD
tara:strand:- start:393 stop:554 length:162 start_codon:yes stop_codon:yes gene_type:complete